MQLSKFNTVIIMSHHRQMTDYASFYILSNIKFILYKALQSLLGKIISLTPNSYTIYIAYFKRLA